MVGKSLASLNLRRRSGVNILAVLSADDPLISLGTVQQFGTLAELARREEAS